MWRWWIGDWVGKVRWVGRSDGSGRSCCVCLWWIGKVRGSDVRGKARGSSFVEGMVGGRSHGAEESADILNHAFCCRDFAPVSRWTSNLRTNLVLVNVQQFDASHQAPETTGEVRYGARSGSLRTFKM
jgi:hypothetical protein